MKGGDVLDAAIIGPYKTERKAEKALKKRMRFNKQRMDANYPLVFVDMPTVPDAAYSSRSAGRLTFRRPLAGLYATFLTRS